MIDRRIGRGVVTSFLAALLTLAPALGFAFVQSTETAGEIPIDLNGTWLVMNHVNFGQKDSSPGPTPAAQGANAPGFNVGYIFTIEHLRTSAAKKLRDAEKALDQAAIDKATKILTEEQRKAGTTSKPLASGGVPVEPKVITYRTPAPPDVHVDTGDEVTINLLDVDLPKPIQDEIDAANKDAKVWEPSEQDLATLKASWKSLKPRAKSEYSKIQWKVTENKYLEGGMLEDEQTKDAKFVISGDATLVQGRQVNRNILIYGAKTVSDQVIEGGHVRATMTTGTYPIPIDMKGSFKMYRLTDMPKPAAVKKKRK